MIFLQLYFHLNCDSMAWLIYYYNHRLVLAVLLWKESFQWVFLFFCKETPLYGIIKTLKTLRSHSAGGKPADIDSNFSFCGQLANYWIQWIIPWYERNYILCDLLSHATHLLRQFFFCHRVFVMRWKKMVFGFLILSWNMHLFVKVQI